MQACALGRGSLPSAKGRAHMSYEHHIYHREREQHCREMAQLASDPDVRRRHEELASLHAARAALYSGLGASGAEISGS